LKGWELHLAGGTHHQGPHRGYFDSVVALAAGYPVVLHPDCPPNILEELYASAAIYWHGAGYGSDPEIHPEAMEHFGMTTVEAMGRGAVPVVFGAGGQTEIVTDGVDGHLFSTIEQLRDLTAGLIEEPTRRRALANSARARSLNFGEGLFCDRILSALEPAIGLARTRRRA
ncbi:MAG: glycosyltransferase, partial [Candidatus Dormibacteraceae bacterium]